MQSSYRLRALVDGTRVVSKRLLGVRSASVCLWVGSGSRDEPAQLNGISHFLEHIVFRGTDRYSNEQIADLIDRFGGRFEAETSFDYTLFRFRVLDRDLAPAFDLLTDMVYRPAFSDVELERRIILEEVTEDDEPETIAADLSMRAAYGDHPLARPVIGTPETIAAISRDDLIAFHAAHYRGDNLVISATGNIEHDELCELAETMATKRAGTAPEPPARIPFTGCRPQRLFVRRPIQQYHVHLSFPGISWSSPREPELVLLRELLCDLEMSRLQRSIREERGLVYSLHSYDERFRDCGGTGISLVTTADNLDECLAVLSEQLQQVIAEGFSADELERVKQSTMIHEAIREDQSMAVARRLGRHLLAGQPFISTDERIHQFEMVKLESLNTYAAELLDLSGRAIAAVGPDEERFWAAAAMLVPHLLKERFAA